MMIVTVKLSRSLRQIFFSDPMGRNVLVTMAGKEPLKASCLLQMSKNLKKKIGCPHLRKALK
uniref:Uncharacterized protein n=1 Tax=Picea sitchensis TaxID=3332 RepID=A9NN69_PICSI|nr:unknown [Picea sitchensis]